MRGWSNTQTASVANPMEIVKNRRSAARRTPSLHPHRGTIWEQGWNGFDSPYVGHTGSWNGTGGGMFGGSKIPDLDIEVGMRLRWTFMCVYWNAMEPNGPVDLASNDPSVAWFFPPVWLLQGQSPSAKRAPMSNAFLQSFGKTSLRCFAFFFGSKASATTLE